MSIKQSPDNFFFDGKKFHYGRDGYPFILYRGKLYIGKQPQGHDQLLKANIGSAPRGYSNQPAGRLFLHKDYTIITFWRDHKITKQLLKRVVNEFQFATQNVLVQIQSYNDDESIFVPFNQLPNNYSDFQTVDNYKAYLQKKTKSMSGTPKPNIGRYKMKDMINNPELYFGKLKQNPDTLTIDNATLHYASNGYPFFWVEDRLDHLYLSSKRGYGHPQFIKEIGVTDKQYDTIRGRVFQYKGFYIITVWKNNTITKPMLDEVYEKFKKLGDVFFEVYSYGQSQSIFVPYSSLPANYSDFRDLDAYKTYIQKKSKRSSYQPKKNQFYDIKRAKSLDMLRNPELYFGKLKQYTQRIKDAMYGSISESGNSVYDRLKFQASHNGYQARIVRCIDILTDKIAVYSTEDLEDAFMSRQQRKSYMPKNSRSMINIQPNFKFLYIPKTNVGVIANIQDSGMLYIFENPSKVCLF